MPDIKKIQRRLAYISIGSSTLRNQGAPGVANAARAFLIKTNLGTFKQVKSIQSYLEILDKLTIELAENFPSKAKNNWGAARKALNVFMEEAFYNKFLNTEYGLDKLGPLLELPIDSFVAKGLKRACIDETPRWRGIKNLNSDDNIKWQKLASDIAAKRKIIRIFLDLEYWRSEKMDPASHFQK